MPHIDVQTTAGERFTYQSIWQRLGLVLVALPKLRTEAGAGYGASFLARRQEFTNHEAYCVVTHDRIPELTAPAVVVADRWGEVVHVATARQVEDLPTVDEVLAWTGHVQVRCPECEGEAR